MQKLSLTLKLTEEIHSETDPEFLKLEKLCKELLGPMHVPHTLTPYSNSLIAGPLPDGTWNPRILVGFILIDSAY